jgi:hypothetical protein
MSRLVTITFALLLVALPAGAANAKEIESARVCGANQCRTVDDRDTLMTLAAGGDTKPPPKNPTGGWYEVRFTVRAEDQVDRWSVAVVPSTRHLRGYDSAVDRYIWMDMTEAAAASYRKIAAGMEPRPISSLRGLNQGPPEVIVDEVIEPPAQPAAPPAGAFPWEWVAGGLAATVLAAGAFVLARRRRRGSAPGQPGPQAAG